MAKETNRQDQSLDNSEFIEQARYCVLSDRWGNMKVKLLKKGMDPNKYIENLSISYSSVMFKTKDNGGYWEVYKTKGTGSIKKIIAMQHDYLNFPELIPTMNPDLAQHKGQSARGALPRTHKTHNLRKTLTAFNYQDGKPKIAIKFPEEIPGDRKVLAVEPGDTYTMLMKQIVSKT